MKGVNPAIERLVKSSVRALNAYHVPAAKGLIKLDAMESPYPLPEEMQQQWLSRLVNVEVNRYPDPECVELKSKLRHYLEIPGGCEILLGNGSDELIQILAMLVGGPGRVFLSPAPSFSMYQQICIATGTEFVGVPLGADFSLNRKKC